MSGDLNKTASKGHEQMLISQEQQAKINEVRRLIGPLSDKASIHCSDASISRYLSSRNWNVKKAAQMLKMSLTWRAKYKPEEIRWEDVADEAMTGKMYRSNYNDKYGRTVLVIRPSRQPFSLVESTLEVYRAVLALVLPGLKLMSKNSKSIEGQIKYFVYCMENAILNLPPHQEQVVWLIDFQGFNLSHISLKLTRETAHVLQEYYPGRLGLAIMYNAPKFFQPFFTMVKPILETKTYNKLKFGYFDDHNTKKMMEDLFDMDHLELAFGGNDNTGFDINKYAERMKEEDEKISSFLARANSLSSVPLHNAHSLDSNKLDADSDSSNKEKIDCSPLTNPDQNILVN